MFDGFSMCFFPQFLGVSIWMFNDDLRSGIKAVQQPKATAAAAAKRTTIWIPILMMYLPVHMFFTALFATFAVVPAAYGSAIWIGGCLIYYLSTIFGEPEHTGGRQLASCMLNLKPIRPGYSILARMCACVSFKHAICTAHTYVSGKHRRILIDTLTLRRHLALPCNWLLGSCLLMGAGGIVRHGQSHACREAGVACV